MKPTIFLGNFEINLLPLRETIESFVQEKSLELLRPLKGYLHDGLEEARSWMTGLRQGFIDSSGKLSDYIKMKWRVKIGTVGMYRIVRKMREYEDVFNLAKGLMNESETFGNKAILRSLTEVNSTLNQVKAMMHNQAGFLDAQEGLYAKGEELWEKVIVQKTDNIKNLLENHYQTILDPVLLSEE